LNRASQPKPGQRITRAPLLRIAYCSCSSPRYFTQKSGRDYAYCFCGNRSAGRGCKEPAVRDDVLEPAVEMALLDILGNLEMFDRVYQPGEDHTDELTEVNEALASLQSQFVAGKVKTPFLIDTAQRLEAKRMPWHYSRPSPPRRSGQTLA
jgi:hypothetical protein